MKNVDFKNVRIERDVPFHNYEFELPRLKVGNSIFFDDYDEGIIFYHRIKNRIRYDKINWEIKSRKVDGGIRIWRVN
jgi:hypothetical protein